MLKWSISPQIEKYTSKLQKHASPENGKLSNDLMVPY